MSFNQEPLPYGYNDLAPHFDASVLEIHYTKHHAGYVAKLNSALAGTNLLDVDLETLVADLSVVPDEKRAAVKKLAAYDQLKLVKRGVDVRVIPYPVTITTSCRNGLHIR